MINLNNFDKIKNNTEFSNELKIILNNLIDFYISEIHLILSSDNTDSVNLKVAYLNGIIFNLNFLVKKLSDN